MINRILGFAILATLVCLGWEYWQESRVISTRVLGPVLSATGGGGWRMGMVVQTPAGYYPLYAAISVQQGTPLILQVRGNGQRYVCLASGKQCVKTVREEWPLTPATTTTPAQ
jgi:hypothetical protein